MSGGEQDPIQVCPTSRPPPLKGSGRSFGASAARLAGLAGAVLGWAPDVFWRATPAELGAVLRALGGDEAGACADGRDLAALMEAYPDG